MTVSKNSPTEENILSGKYPLRRPFILVTKTNVPLSENARKFFDFVMSDEAKNIITMMGAIPVK